MNKNFALIKNGLVVNVIVATDEFMESYMLGQGGQLYDSAIDTTNHENAAIGKVWNSGTQTFDNPEEGEQ